MLRDEMDLGLVGLTDKEPRCEVSFEALVHEALQLKPTRAAVSLVQRADQVTLPIRTDATIRDDGLEAVQILALIHGGHSPTLLLCQCDPLSQSGPVILQQGIP